MAARGVERSAVGAGVSQGLVPMQCLQNRGRNDWLSDPRDAAAIRTKAGLAGVALMEADLLKPVGAMRRHVGP